MHQFVFNVLFFAATFISTSSASAYSEEKINADDFAKLVKLHNELKSMAGLKLNLKGQRRSDQVELEGSTTTTSSPVQPPIARMAVDDGRLHTTSSVQTAAPVYSTAAPTSSTAAPAYPTAAPVSLTVAPANYTAGLANSTATSGNATAALRECLHPKDVNCKQATVSVRKNDVCEGDSCPKVLPKVADDKSKTNKTNADIFGFLKRVIFWEN